jgi:hypothetical protein
MWYWQQTPTNALFVKLLWLKEKAPIFEITRKVDWEYIKDKASFIDWQFESIETSSYEYEGKDRPIFKLTLTDWPEKYVLSFSYTATSRNILNCLCGATKLGKLRLEVRWYSKDWVAKNAIKVLNDWEKMERQLPYNNEWNPEAKITMTSLVEIIKNGKWEYVSSDYSELDKYFSDQFEAINGKKKTIEVETSFWDELKAKAQEEDDNELLPF